MSIKLDVDLYKQFFHQAFIGMTISKVEGHFLEVNHMFCEMLGYTNEELLKLSYKDITHPADLIENKYLVDKLINWEITNFQIEKRYICKDGTMIWAITTVSRIKGTNLTISQVKDITKQKEKEMELKEKKKNYRLMTEYCTDLIMRHHPDGKAFSVSPSAKEILGYEPEELIGASPYDPQIIHPDDLPRTIMSHKQIFDTSELIKVRYRIINKKGKYVWIESTAKAIYDQSTKQIQEIITVSRDCTEQVINDIKLQRAKERLETSNLLINNIVESITDGFLALDGVGNILYINTKTERKADKNRQELLGRNLWDEYPELKGSEIQNKFIESIKKQVHIQVEFFYQKFNTWLDVHFYPRKGIVAICFEDITERKKYEDFLNKVDKLNLVGELAAGVAHEIRNPLTTIKGFMQYFQSTRTFNEEYFNLINEEFERVESIIYEFLTLAKPHTEIQFKEENIIKILEDVIKLENTNALLKNVELYFESEQKSLLTMCDKHALKQVFINILQNAIEATSEKGKIRINIKEKNDQSIEISFKDNGLGIPKHLIQRLGEPFYSLKEKGTGLGLMICFKIIETHKGRILIESEEGEGTTIFVQLPRLS